MSPLLENRVAIVTGAGRGLGKALALKFAGEGAKLLLPDVSLERAESTAREIRARGGEAAAILTDISDENATSKMAEKVMELYGRTDILLNNAAFFSDVEFRPWDAWTVELWDRFFEVNVRGTWLCCRAIAPLMIKQSRGKIINIVSNVIKLPPSHMNLAYACSKAAVCTMTQSLARALGPSGINVNAIAPGFTATEVARELPDFEKRFEGTIATQCLKRREEPEDLVGAALFLASSQSDFVTGQILYVDGGCATV